MNELQRSVLNIMVDVDKICRENNIKYFLVSGTALGAVRHGGFIPWDDDFDIGMMRSEYNKFLEIAQEKLGSKYFVQNIDTEKKYYQMFTKIRKNGTLFLEPSIRNLNINKGIFIDVFPFDYAPKDEYNIILNESNKLQYYLYNQTVPNTNDYPNFSFNYMWKTFKTKLKNIIFSLYPKSKLIKRINKLSVDVNNELENSNVPKVLICHAYRKPNMCFDDNIILPVTEIEYEGYKFYMPNNSHEYLKEVFGEYMNLPPEDQRITHNPMDLIL